MVRAVHLRVLPESRSECAGGARPCPYVTCRYHLLLDIGEGGRLLKARDFDEGDADGIAEALREMPETCALDVADRGSTISRVIGDAMGVRRDTVEMLISGALQSIRDGEHDWEEREHPEDFYVRYSNMGAAELAELAAELRRKAKDRG